MFCRSMCLFAGAERSLPCLFFVLALLSCVPLASTDTVVRRESPYSAGTSISNKVYEHELLHEGTVQAIREAMQNSNDPYKVAESMVADVAPNLQEVALHEAESLADEEVGERDPKEDSMLESKEGQSFPGNYLKKAVQEYATKLIEQGESIYFKTKDGRYLMVSFDCSHQPTCHDDSEDIFGCVTLTHDADKAEKFQIKEVGSPDKKIHNYGVVSLMSETLTNVSPDKEHGYYLGICKPPHADEANGFLYFFRRHTDTTLHGADAGGSHHYTHSADLMMPNVGWVISWEAGPSRFLESMLPIMLRSPLAAGYIICDTAQPNDAASVLMLKDTAQATGAHIGGVENNRLLEENFDVGDSPGLVALATLFAIPPGGLATELPGAGHTGTAVDSIGHTVE